ncbi:Ribosome-recycling factor chloroplastic [Zea mays]|nr:Ribosome-recycling factor chloroplastic [Zea mays]
MKNIDSIQKQKEQELMKI